jgi:predicted transglutaminase-like cysteine proteinase
LSDRLISRWFAKRVLADQVRLWVLGTLMALLLGSLSYSAPDFDRMYQLVLQHGGAPALQRFQNWRNLVATGANGTDMDRLTRVNTFFNRNILFAEDALAWGQDDYWETPLEALSQGRGDCEDYVISKYFALQLMGVAPDKLRLVYVRAKTGSGNAVSSQAHMVLAYYAQPDAEPLVLDNLIGDIRPASRRPDLSPVFSFNKEGVFTGAPGKVDVKIGGIGRLSRWEDLLKRAQAEGFE